MNQLYKEGQQKTDCINPKTTEHPSGGNTTERQTPIILQPDCIKSQPN